eukprot:CAMPEP_0170761686 /NCGR_PEP_ID=MMETSP0733-20121128/2320_1 /TAXON_ID=186038 /ORGANISM="Fragilariopsis kerguelensis, Strain L26-C5" /LENGTH=358 /DNA_ID=CAMNT_0011101719 /DNA_START=187 /DNA_END=1263 /DNA_ORIENTATION=+
MFANEDGWDLATCDPKLKEVLAQFDYDGNGFVSKDEVAQGADLYVKEQKITKKQKKQMHWLFATIVCLFLLSGGLAVGLSLNTVHKIDANKDTLVNLSSGKMMVKDSSAAASSSSSRRLLSSWTEILSDMIPSLSRHLEDDMDETSTADVIDVTIRADGSTYSPEVMDGTNCYSHEAVTAMFVSVATGVTSTLTETNQTTNAFHVLQLGTSNCPDSSIVWSEHGVQLGCVVMAPSRDCTNMARRDRHLSELDDEDALHAHHRSLKEHVVNIIAGGGHTAVNHNQRILNDDTGIFYTQSMSAPAVEEPETCDQEWEYLSIAQQQAAAVLGYTESLWDAGIIFSVDGTKELGPSELMCAM